jgi:hypothetical protein
MPPVARALPFVVVIFIWSMTTHGKFSDSGDEPHYLLVSESLVADHDFDVRNNYENHDGRWYGADTLEPENHARTMRTGAMWSTHDFGLPVLIAPVYYAATRLASHVSPDTLARVHQTQGLFAYSIISLALTMLTAWGIALFRSGVARIAAPRAATIVAAALALSPPVLSHAFLVFPETPALFVCCAVVWLWCLREEELTPRRMLLVALAVGLMPWLHRKYVFLVFGLMFVIWRRHRAWFVARGPRAMAVAAALAIGPQVLLHLVTLWAWGHVGGPHLSASLPFTLGGMARGAIGLLFDRERGLAGFAPIYLVAPAAFALGWRAYRDWLVPIALLFLPMAAFIVWSAGFSPAARYLVPLMPLVALPAASALARPRFVWISLPWLAFQAAITAFLWNYPRALWPLEQGTNQALDAIPLIGPAYARALPSIMTGDSTLLGWVWVGVAAALAIWTSPPRIRA